MLASHLGHIGICSLVNCLAELAAENIRAQAPDILVIALQDAYAPMHDPHGLLARNRAVVGAVVGSGLAEAADGDDAEVTGAPAMGVDGQGRRSPELDVL